jgi:esterase
MKRHDLRHNGLRLSYLDSGNEGRALVALHAHIMESTTFIPLAEALPPGWRIIALDQRGHGYSDHAPSYTRDDYISDLESLFEHLHLTEAVLLGNSLGGVNAYQFAARHPDKVRALIIEDIGTEIADNLNFVLAWDGRFATRDALAESIGPLASYLQDSFRETPSGWTLAFNPHDIVASGRCLAGDHSQDWIATRCPALLLRGRDSDVTTQVSAERMASQRPNTRLETLDGGHVLHVDNPSAFMNAVNQFLRQFP